MNADSQGNNVPGASSQPVTPSPAPYQPYIPQPLMHPVPGVQPGDTATTAATPASPRRYAVPVGIAVLGLFIFSAGFVLGGEPKAFMTIGLEVLPLAVLAMLAYGGVKNTVARVFSYIWLVLFGFGVLFNSFASTLVAEIKDYSILTTPGAVTPGSTSLSDIFKPDAGPALFWTVVLLFLASLISMSLLLRPVRVLVARVIPIDPDNFVHTIALPILTLILLSSFAPLIALGGRPPILELVKSGGLEATGGDSSVGTRPQDLIYQFAWTIPAAFIIAGWPIARNFRGALVRLGLVRPTMVQVGAGIGFGVVLAAVSMVALDPGITALWQTMGWGTTDTTAFTQLLSKLITPAGAVLIGVTAGVGEELAVRGLLQPRIGLIASNLVFTSLHAYQYGFDGLLSVFIVGLILGIIRSRTNTTTSAIVHGVYDFILVLVTYLAGSPTG